MEKIEIDNESKEPAILQDLPIGNQDQDQEQIKKHNSRKCFICKERLCNQDECEDHCYRIKDAFKCFECHAIVCEDCEVQNCIYNDCQVCPACSYCLKCKCGTIFCNDCSYSHDKHCRICPEGSKQY